MSSTPARGGSTALLATAVLLPTFVAGILAGSPPVLARPLVLTPRPPAPVAPMTPTAAVGAASPPAAETAPVVVSQPALQRRAAAIPSATPPPSAPSAAAVPTPGSASNGPTWEERRGAEALALLTYPWHDLGWQISFHPARSGVLGIASHSERRIRMYVRRSQSVRLLAFSVAHEIGHAVDFELATPDSHMRWLELRGIEPDTPWYGCEGCADLETPAGDFAEVFAVWQVGPVDYRSRMAPLPGEEEMDVLAEELNAGGPRM